MNLSFIGSGPRSLALASVLALALVQGQSAAQRDDKTLNLDAASVKPATIPGVTVDGERMSTRKGGGARIPREIGGPGTDDPGRIHYPLISLKALLHRAYDSYHDIEGPEWLNSQTVQVDATMPPPTTKEQFQQMLRNLIVERFQLKCHSEKREVTGYDLVIAKGGPKFKESVETPAMVQRDSTQKRGPVGWGSDGFPILPKGPASAISQHDGRTRVYGQEQPMAELARILASRTHGIVTDATGLKAKYDYTVTYRDVDAPGAPNSASDGDMLPDLFAALQSQLGLKLEPKKVPVEVLVIDHMEKMPAAN